LKRGAPADTHYTDAFRQDKANGAEFCKSENAKKSLRKIGICWKA
jgi:hypothetical protein